MLSNLPGTPRVCRHCQQQSIILRSMNMGLSDLCTLDCGHHCVFERGFALADTSTSRETERTPDMSIIESGVHRGEKKCRCASCDTTFVTYMETIQFTEFCSECRVDLGLNTVRDAEEILGLLDITPLSGRKDLADDMRKKRRAQNRAPWMSRLPDAAPSIPPPDPAKVMAAIRTQIDYGTLAGEAARTDAKPIEYIIAKNGLFEVRHTDIADIVLQPKEVLGVETVLQPGIHLLIPHLPFSMLQQTVAFFKQVQKDRNGAEAFVRIWWHRAEQRFEIHCPQQRVTGGGVHHTDDFDRDNSGEWLLVADIHSHNTMSAFWSGIDDADERRAPEGRICGVIGKITQTIPEWKWRMRTREGFAELDLSAVWDMPSGTAAESRVDFSVTWDVILRCLGKTDGHDAQGNIVLSCPVDPFRTATFPQEWMSRVVNNWHGGGHGHAAGFGGVTYGGPGAGSSFGHRHAGQYIYILDKGAGDMKEYQLDGNQQLKETGKRVALAHTPKVH